MSGIVHDTENPLATKRAPRERFEIEDPKKEVQPEKSFVGKVIDFAEEKFKHMANIETAIADTEDFPSVFKWFTFVIYSCALIALFIYLFWFNYNDARTSTFITLDPKSGVCAGDAHSTQCCEVPQAVTGEFLLDSRSRWNTQTKFNFNRAMYGVTMTGVMYTNEEWSSLMKTIKDQMYTIGVKRGRFRDFSWNLIAWCSFTAVNTASGYIQFYAVGDVGMVFNRQIVTAGYGANISDASPCNQPITANYVSSNRVLTVTTDLSSTGTDNCVYKQTGSVTCQNPCPNIMAPQAFGYNGEVAVSTEFSWAVDMASVSTAISVNMGIQKLSSLVNFPGDNNRITLLRDMYNYGYINQWTRNQTSSYYESLYAPMDPIYCVDYSNMTGDATSSDVASCFVRVGNTLLYPYINSFGWSATGYEYPTPCKNSTVLSNPAAKYFCNQYDFVVSFLYYPVADVNVTALIANATTNRPTRAPTTFKPSTHAPSGPTRFPTARPTMVPTVLNSRPTVSPTTARPSTTKAPTRVPTVAPSAAPIGTPTDAPVFIPIDDPTETPTAEPTIARRRRLRDNGAQGDADLAQVDSLLAGTHSSNGNQEAVDRKASAPTRNAPVTEVDVDLMSSTGTGGSGSGGGGGSGSGTSGDAPTPEPTQGVYYYNSGGSSGSSYAFPIPPSNYYQPGADSSSGSATEPSDASSPDAPHSYNYYQHDDFTPLVPEVIDNGKVFKFAHIAAMQRNSSSQEGDIWVPQKGYYAALSSLLGTTSSTSSFTKDFNRICAGKKSSEYTPSGCAIFSIEFYGGSNRIVSIYDYQPSNTPSYTNTLYNSQVMAYAVKTPPTVLIQSYYSCVMTVWNALQAASGLAVANTQAYIGLGIMAYVYIAVLIYNQLLKSFVPYKSQKLMEEQLEEEQRQAFLGAILEDVRAGRLTGAFSAEEVIKKTEAEKAARILASQQEGASVKNFLSSMIGAAPGGD